MILRFPALKESKSPAVIYFSESNWRERLSLLWLASMYFVGVYFVVSGLIGLFL